MFERLKISDFLRYVLKVFYQHWDTECVLLTSICQSISLICSPVISLTSAQYILEIYSLHILEKITQKAFTYLYWQTPSPRWPFQLIETGQTCTSWAGWYIIWRQSLLGVEGRALGMLWSTCIFIGPIPDYCTLLVFHATQYILIPNQLGELTNIKNKRDNNYK